MDNFYSNFLDIYSNIFSFFQQEVQTFECSSTFDKYTTNNIYKYTTNNIQ